MSKINPSLILTMTSFAKKNYSRIAMLTCLLLLSGFFAAFGQTLTQSGFTSVLTPQYMAGGSSTRLPVMYRATVTGLAANTTYRYFTQAALTSDFGTTNPGAGNPLLISPAGTAYSYTSSPALSSSGNYQTFTTDASGNYTGWFGFVNTGNDRFSAGNLVYPTIIIGNTSGSTLHRRALDVSIKVLEFSTSASASKGSFLKETSSGATAKNLVAIYDNTSGTGRPLYIAPVEAIGVSISSVISGYTTAGGGWNAIIPNVNANGVRRIEQRSVTTGDIVGCATDADGSWPTGPVNTVNPNKGTTAIIISYADAPLNTCVVPCPAITVTATAGMISCNGGTTSVTVSAAGGTAPYTGTGTFTTGAGTFNYTVTDANGCTGTASVTIDQPAALVATSSATEIACAGGSSTITVSATGGTAPYTGTGTFSVTAGSYTYTITDANGCTTTTGITVSATPDNTPPSITAPASLVLSTNEACGVTGIDLGTPVTSDNCTVASVTNNAPSIFPLGPTTITWTVTDGNGNTATATQTVTVTDTTKPVIYLRGSALLAGITGSSSSQTPYLIPAKPGIKFTSILSVNDVTAGGYRMAGIADGLGAFDNGDGTFTVLMNHEIGNTLGIARAHGSKGSFVSKWIINKSDLSVASGSDLMQRLYLWNPATSTYSLGTVAFSRFCSADLPAVSAFYNSATGLGTRERIFLNGEESGTEGKAVGHIVTGADAGTSYELPYLGKFAWENAVASPSSGNKTIVAGMDDGTGGQVYIYIGTKTNAGTDIDKAGLSNGKLFGVKITGLTAEVNGSTPAPGTRFDLVDHGFVQNMTGAALNTASVAAGVTTFMRPEDGAWDPSSPNDFYFATTNAFNAPTRLWRLRFDNIATPETGGTVEAVLNGTEGGQMFDNISIDKSGHILLVEDVGNNAHIGKVWQYTIATDELVKIAEHDPARFLAGGASFLTQDEEASGNIDVSEILGPGMSLIDVQAHYTPASNGTEVVEGGQLLAMFNPYLLGTSTATDTLRVYIASGCTANVELGTPAAADNCSVASVTNNAPATFPIGTTIVTWTVTDGSGNTATADQIVIVADTTKPTITAPPSLTANTNEGCTAAGINIGTPVASDNCALVITNDAPVAFPLGTTIVTWTATDSSGNSATATQTVTVVDNVNPVIYLQGNTLLSGITGSSSSQTPYLLPGKPGIRFTSILSVNDLAGGYRMAGIADGLGAFDNGNGTFTLLVNHEIGNTLGIARAHGSKGSFVSKWIVNKSDLSVVSGSDLMQRLYLWNPATNTYSLGTLAFSRFCSADLPAVSAFYNSATGLGTRERIFMDGEESGTEGKAVGHIVTGADAGTSYELPYLGKFAWENAVASPTPGDKTIVAGMDDGTGGQVYIYVGTKTNTGTDIDKAGLNNGKLFGVKITGLPAEVNGSTPAPGTRFELIDHGFVQNTTGAALNTASVAAGVTTFMRPEDGAWDPSNPNDFYFATTNAFNAPTRLWRLRFDNIATPETGGTAEAVLDGTEGGQMFDNIAVDKLGHILLTEDVGNNAHLGKIWQYTIATDELVKIAEHDSTRFRAGGASFLTQDEEASGIIDVSEILGPGMSLVDVQAHYTPALNGTEVVEGGQLLAMFNPYLLGTSTAPDTIRVSPDPGLSTATVSLGTPATADNCSVASVTNNAPAAFPVGTTIVTWTVTDASGNTSTADQVVIVSSIANVPPAVTINSPVNGATYPAGSTITLSATATDTDGTVTKVEFYNDGVKFAESATSPYQFTGQNMEPGSFVLTAKAFDNAGDSTVSDTVRITVTACEGSGSITAEGYTDINGSRVSDLTSNPAYPNSPTIVTTINKLEYANIGHNYGGRLRGYICAPQTGYYVFYIAGDDQCGLWLSTDENPANKTLIAYVQDFVSPRAWVTYATQKSVPIKLIKGARYYIETLHKQYVNGDHLAVAWKMPNDVFEGPIPGNRLSPFETPAPVVQNNPRIDFETAMRSAAEPASGISKLTVSAIPNPSSTHFNLITKSKSNETLIVNVIDVLGRVVEKRAQVAANGTIQIGGKLLAGVYFVEVIQGTQKERLKLVKQ